MKYSLSEIKKTLVASIPFVLAAVKVISDGLGDGTVSNQEWIAAAVAGLTALGVFAAKNTPAPGQPAKPDVSEADGEYPPDVPAHFDRP